MEALIAALLAAILGALGISDKVERGVETQLRRSLGQVQQVNVEIHRGHRSLLSRQVDSIDITLAGFEARGLPAAGLTIGGGGDLVGKVGKVAIHAHRFRVNDLPVERLEITIADIRYDLWKALWRRKLEIIRIGDSYAEAWLDPDALSRMLAPRIKQIDNLRLSFHHGRISVSGYKRIGVRIPVRLTCSLSASDGRIYIVEPQAHVSVVPVPGFITARLIEEINPLVDLNEGQQGPFQLKIERIRIAPESLWLRARLQPRLTH